MKQLWWVELLLEGEKGSRYNLKYCYAVVAENEQGAIASVKDEILHGLDIYGPCKVLLLSAELAGGNVACVSGGRRVPKPRQRSRS